MEQTPSISPARAAAWRDNSRRRCAQAGIEWRDVDLGDIFAAGGGACHVCGRALDIGGTWDPDHVQALGAGGLHELANLRPACQRCNRARGARPAPDDAAVTRRRAGLATVILAGQLEKWGVPCLPAAPTIGPHVLTLNLAIQPGFARLALALAAEVRALLNAPGARVTLAGATLAVELPRAARALVELGSMPGRGLAVGLGLDAGGRVVELDLAAVPHVLIGGQTGSGKSTAMRSIIAGLARAGACRLALADSDADTWAPFTRSAALAWAVAGDALAAGDLVLTVAEAMNRRAPGDGPPLVLAVDEVQQLDGPAMEALLDIARRGRKRGVLTLIGTQYVRGDILNRALTDQYPARIAGRVHDATASRLILGQPGAELLQGRGDMLLSAGGRLTRLQVALGRAADFGALDQVESEPAPAVVDAGRAAHPGHAQNVERNGAALAWAVENGGPSADAIRKRWACGMDRARVIRDQARRLIAEGLPADRLTLDSGA